MSRQFAAAVIGLALVAGCIGLMEYHSRPVEPTPEPAPAATPTPEPTVTVEDGVITIPAPEGFTGDLDDIWVSIEIERRNEIE